MKTLRKVVGLQGYIFLKDLAGCAKKSTCFSVLRSKVFYKMYADPQKKNTDVRFQLLEALVPLHCTGLHWRRLIPLSPGMVQ